MVARITRIRVRETVPDSVLDRADEIEVVDLTPDDLLQRLREGKVYVPQTATRALAHYFSPGNLTALRELALRRTAQRVDAQLLDHMQAHAIRGPWAAGERVLVCVTPRRRRRRRWCATGGAWRSGCARRGRRCMSRRRARCGWRRRRATASRRRCGWPNRSAPRPSPCPAATSRTRSSTTRARTTSPISSSAIPARRAGGSGRRWRNG